MSTSLDAVLRATPNLISLKKLAVLLGIYYQTLYGHTREGRIPHVLIGSRIKFDGPTVADWTAKRAIP